MSLPPLDKYLQALMETLLMAGVSSLIAICAGLALAIVLHTTQPGGLYARPRLHKGLSVAVNICRAIPFIILLVALLPVTRAIVGTTLGTWAAVVPLSANLIPFFARIAQVSLGRWTAAWWRRRGPWGCAERRSCARCCCPRHCRA